MSELSQEQTIHISLKWGKNTYNNQITIQPGESAHSLKLKVESQTAVPVQRQKLLCPKVWKGALKDGDNIPDNVTGKKKGGKKGGAIVVTLIGSAETLIEKPLDERPRFSEDMTPEELWKATRSGTNNGCEGKGEDDDIVDIVALQKDAGMDRDDGKTEMYEYNRLVTGLPQQQINDMLVSRKKKKTEEGAEADNSCDSEGQQQQSLSSMPLLGEVAMTMGMELRRAYINSLAVLPNNGTIVSGLDDGHVQLWRRGQLVKDARHTSAKVDHVLAFPSSSSRDNNGPAFVTAGDGSICLWTGGGNHLMQFGSYPGTSPSSIAVGNIGGIEEAGSCTKYLAACFRITRKVDPNQFRLVPQNEAERRRREAAEAQEQMIQNELSRVSKVVKIWFYDDPGNNQSGSAVGVMVREDVISPDAIEETAPVTKLLDMNGKLVCGDSWGGIRIFEWVRSSASESNNNLHGAPRRHQRALLQFRGSTVACLAQVKENLLAVSIQPAVGHETTGILSSAISLPVTSPRGIYIVDANATEAATIKVVLDAHSDTVQCICPLPHGAGILSAGGKMDATVRVWDALAVSDAIEDCNAGNEVRIVKEAKIMKQPGYVFDLKVLPDSNGSNVYAIAVARYNVLKIII